MYFLLDVFLLAYGKVLVRTFSCGDKEEKKQSHPPCAHQIIPDNLYEGDHTVFDLTIIWAELAVFIHLKIFVDKNR